MSKAGRRGIEKSGNKVHMILDLHENYSFEITTYNWTKGFLRKSLQHGRKKKSILIMLMLLSFSARNSGMHLLKSTRRFQKLYSAPPNVPDIPEKKQEVHDAVKVNIDKNLFVVLYFGIVAEKGHF